jgi:hypothetical protein
VRKLLAWDRYDTHEAVAAINDLYGQELRLWLNLFLPSVKLVKKVRVGSRVRRVYEAARTPFERVRECVQADPEKVAKLEELRKRLDPFQLSRIIERKLERARIHRRRLPMGRGPRFGTIFRVGREEDKGAALNASFFFKLLLLTTRREGVSSYWTPRGVLRWINKAILSRALWTC